MTKSLVRDWPVDAGTLRSLQLLRLRKTVAHAQEKSPFYRRRLAEHGVAADEIRTLEDVRRLPFTTKSDLRDSYPFGMFAVPREAVARIHASSGTTGQPTVVGYTKADLDTWAHLVARSLHAAGARAGMRVHNAYGYGLFTGGLGAHYGAEALGCTVIPVSGGQTERQVRLICDFEPEVILVTPSYMLAILDEFRRQGLEPRASSLRYGVFGAEPWSPAMRREIEQAFNLRATDIYGLSEAMGPGVAQAFVDDPEDGDGGGATIWEDHFLVEVVDPASGEPVPDGELGELVITTLTKEALPILRYRTRDLTRLLPGLSTPMRRMARITARSDDMLIVRGVNIFPTQVEAEIAKCEHLAPHYTIEISRPDRMDQMLVQVEMRAGGDTDRRAACVQMLSGLLKENLGVTARVEVVDPFSLPRSTGKAHRVRDLRPR